MKKISILENGFGLYSTSSNKQFLLKNRSQYSNELAIKKISQYGIAQVRKVLKKHILEEYKPFIQKKLSGEQLLKLLTKIHSEKNGDLTLVHGDFSRNNTTIINDELKCFDYEHTHWGSPFIDLGKLLLREYTVQESIEFLNEYYQEKFDNIDCLKKGIIEFCNWQHTIRKEKNLNFSGVPLIRAKRISISSNVSIEKILNDFKAEI